MQKPMDKASVARMVALVIVLINAVANLLGFETIPEELGGEIITAAILMIVGIWTAWKNNYLARKGLKQKEVLKKNNLE